MFEPYNPYNPYSPYYYNFNQQTQQIPRQNPQPYKPQNISGLQGKVVDSLDVVKAADIPYDGSVSYFPLTDNSAIITKQLQQDGTSKIVIYKPMSENNDKEVKYITENDFTEKINNMNNSFREQIKNISSNDDDLKSIKEDIKTLKRKLEDITDDIKYKKEK